MVDKASLTIYLSNLLHRSISVKDAIDSDVNLTYNLLIDAQPYIVKLMTRKPLSVSERYRFLHSKQIIERLSNLIEVPCVEYVDTSLHRIDDTIVYSILILEKVNGTRLDKVWSDLSEEQQCQFSRSFAETMNNIYEQTYPDFGNFSINSKDVAIFSSWDDFVLNKVQTAVNKLSTQKLIDNSILQQARDYIYSTQEDWQYNDDARLVHSDLWQGNIIVNPDDLKTFYILDWEWAYPGDPVMDLIALKSEMFPNSSNRVIDSFFNAYRLDQLEIEKKLNAYNIFSMLRGAAFGFLYHNPYPAGYDRVAKTIQSILDQAL